MKFRSTYKGCVVKLDVFDLEVIFVFGKPENVHTLPLKKEVKERVYDGILDSIDQYSKDFLGVTFSGYEEWVIYLPKFRLSSPKDIGTLQHEIFHVVSVPLRSKGFKLSDGSEEAFAHVIGHVTEKVFEYLYSKRKK